MAQPKRMKICLTANPGGHLQQLQRLRPAWDKHDVFYILGHSEADATSQPSTTTYQLRPSDRKRPFAFLLNLGTAFRILRRERPDVILSTGASIGAAVCLVGRLLRIPVVWVDSLANTRKLSMSGNLVRRLAARTYTQWPEPAAGKPDVRYRRFL